MSESMSTKHFGKSEWRVAAVRYEQMCRDQKEEIERLREALRRANEAIAPYANHFGVAKHVADITKEALGDG